MFSPSTPLQSKDPVRHGVIDSNVNVIPSVNPVPTNAKKEGHQQRARGVSLLMLVREKILEPGIDALTMDYLGEKYTSDLLDTGKILWRDKQFASPSAWAIYVKKQIDPSKKSGCGWNSVKYRGKKLDVYKSMYNKKHKPSPSTSNPIQQAVQVVDENSKVGMVYPQHPIKLSKLTEYDTEIHPNTSVECEVYDEALGKIQPFFVSVSSNCLLLINFHCHLTHSEVVGYLGGKWDQEKRCLSILQAFPCKCRLGDRQNAAVTEEQIRLGMQKKGLVKVGWYHSHPASPAEPTLRDIDCQTQYQMKYGISNPMLALICSPSYGRDNLSTESTVNAFWVDQNEQSMPTSSFYGAPMRFAFSEFRDFTITPDLYQELSWLVDYYSPTPDLVNFSEIWRGNMTYLERLKLAVLPKMPKDANPNLLVPLLQKLAAVSQ